MEFCDNPDVLCVILAGRCGSGKTHLAKLARLATGGTFISEPRLVSQLHEAYSNNEGDDVVLRSLRQADTLIIDDVGAAYVRSQSNWQQSIYWSLLDGRYEAKRKLMITTNKTMQQLRDWLGERAMSRLSALLPSFDFAVEMFDVPDYRARHL
jgi:DNA replication protein DnaC